MTEVETATDRPAARPAVREPGRETPRGPALTPIGLDIGQSFIRAVQLNRQDSPAGPRWRVIDAAQWEQRPGADAGRASAPGLPGMTTDAAGRLERGFRQRVFRGRRVVVGLSPPDVDLHALELPPEAEGENRTPLAAAARIELERLMRSEEGSVETDFWRVPPGRASRITALGVGAARARVLDIWNLCRDARVDCRAIDALPCALARLGSLLHVAPPRHVWAALDIGLRAARLTMCVGEVPVLVRLLDAGGQKWTQRIADGLQVSPESAERHKRDHGLALARRGVRRRGAAGAADIGAAAGSGAADLSGMIAAVLRVDMEHLVAEIERSYSYVMQCYPDRSVGSLLLAGGAALTRNLDRYLGEKLGIEVRGVDEYVVGADSPLIWDQSQRQQAGQFAAAIGLALYGGPLT